VCVCVRQVITVALPVCYSNRLAHPTQLAPPHKVQDIRTTGWTTFNVLEIQLEKLPSWILHHAHGFSLQRLPGNVGDVQTKVTWARTDADWPLYSVACRPVYTVLWMRSSKS